MSIESFGVTSSVSPDTFKRPDAATAVQTSEAKRVAEPVSIRSIETAELSPEMIDETVAKLEESINRLNAMMQDGQRSLNFSVEKDLNKVVVKVMDVQTEEIVRQFPNEEALKFAKHLEGMMGLLFNDKA